MQYQRPAALHERQCIAILPRPKSKRCGREVSKAEMMDTIRLAREVATLSGQEKSAVMRQITLLHVCAAHRKGLDDNKAEIDSLVSECDRSLLAMSNGYETTSAPPELKLVPYASTPRRVKDLLTSPIHPQQDAKGHVYVYTWPAAPEFVKIGYAKESADKRVKKWGRCHAGAQIHLTAEVPHPERTESLIHAQMADQRHQIEACSMCQKSHIEIFKISVQGVRGIIAQWQEVPVKGKLYTVERRLSEFWVDATRHVPVTTAADLLQVLHTRDGSQAPTPTNEVITGHLPGAKPQRLAVSPGSVDDLATSMTVGLGLSSQ